MTAITELLPPETTQSAGQQLYEWLAAHARRPYVWPPWEQLSPMQHAILARWAARMRQSLEEERHA